MKLIIDISEELYAKVPTLVNKGSMWIGDVLEAVKNGTPLPKGCDIQRIIPKRVDVQKWIYTKCPNPNCNYELSAHHGDGYYSIEHKPDFCPACGQTLLWESSLLAVDEEGEW